MFKSKINRVNSNKPEKATVKNEVPTINDDEKLITPFVVGDEYFAENPLDQNIDGTQQILARRFAICSVFADKVDYKIYNNICALVYGISETFRNAKEPFVFNEVYLINEIFKAIRSDFSVIYDIRSYAGFGCNSFITDNTVGEIGYAISATAYNVLYRHLIHNITTFDNHIELLNSLIGHFHKFSIMVSASLIESNKDADNIYIPAGECEPQKLEN